MFRIGEFANFSKVSVKMLRHYDEIGLFQPAWIDPDSQYRYYRAEQLLHLNKIIALKELGFSLEQIKQLTADQFSAEQFRGLLKLRRLALEEKLEETAVQLLQVKNRLAQLDQSAVTPSDVVVRHVAAEQYAAIRQNREETPAPISELFDEVERWAAQHNARAAKPPVLVYHGDGELESLDVEILVPVTRDVGENGRVYTTRTQPVKQMACLIHTGSYSTMPDTYAILVQWISDHNFKIGGSTRELFLKYSGDEQGYTLPEQFVAANAAQFVTELQIPIETDN